MTIKLKKINISIFVLLITVTCGFSETIVSTGFDSYEGWQEQGVTNPPNPATGNWWSWGETTNSWNPLQIDTSFNGMQFEASPRNGDGLLYADRISSNSIIYDSAVDTPGDKNIFIISFDLQVNKESGSYAIVACKNTNYTGSIGSSTYLCCIKIDGDSGNISYWNGSSYELPYSGTGLFKPVGNTQIWGRIQIILDTQNSVATISSLTYLTPEMATVAEVPFTNLVGDNIMRSLWLATGPASRSYFDNLEIINCTEKPVICGDEGTIYLSGDINKDCRVDLKDFNILAQQWLKCKNPEDISCIN